MVASAAMMRSAGPSVTHATPEIKPPTSLPPEACISSEALVERLAQARAEMTEPNPILACDADGTLWSGDVGNDVFLKLIETHAVRTAAYPALVREAEAFGITRSGIASEVAKALYDACEAGHYPEERCFAMMTWAFAGASRSEVIAFSQTVAKETNLEGRLHRFLDPVFDWARRENIPIWIVSASPNWMVEIGAAMFGIPSEHVIGMAPVLQEGQIMPELAGVPIYGPNKPLMLRKTCPQGTLLGGFGDSTYDIPLLQMAKVPVAVRPKASLWARASEVPNIVAVGV